MLVVCFSGLVYVHTHFPTLFLGHSKILYTVSDSCVKWGVQIARMIFQTVSNVLMLPHAAYFTDQALEDMVHNSLIVTSQYFKTMKEQP